MGAVLLLMTACGGDGSSGSGAIPDDGIRTVVITGNDRMEFGETRVEAHAGETLRVVLDNIGRMPKKSMGHNWVLFDAMPQEALNRLAMEAAQRPVKYLPDDRSVILAKIPVLGPGERAWVVFQAPEAPGEYVFACTFPGHFALMRGVLVIE
jgi:azurin